MLKPLRGTKNPETRNIKTRASGLYFKNEIAVHTSTKRKRVDLFHHDSTAGKRLISGRAPYEEIRIMEESGETPLLH